MTERFPDLEIYLLNPDAAAVSSWLATVFNTAAEVVSSSTGRTHWHINGMDVFLNDKAEKNFASLWFKQNSTPWNNDLDCGRAAFAALGYEVRCSDSGWQEGESEDAEGGWIKINRNGEKPFSW